MSLSMFFEVFIKIFESFNFIRTYFLKTDYIANIGFSGKKSIMENFKYFVYIHQSVKKYRKGGV